MSILHLKHISADSDDSSAYRNPLSIRCDLCFDYVGNGSYKCPKCDDFEICQACKNKIENHKCEQAQQLRNQNIRQNAHSPDPDDPSQLVLIRINFIWNIIKYFLLPKAYVLPQKSDIFLY